jgi:hypothetical protein
MPTIAQLRAANKDTQEQYSDGEIVELYAQQKGKSKDAAAAELGYNESATTTHTAYQSPYDAGVHAAQAGAATCSRSRKCHAPL